MASLKLWTMSVAMASVLMLPLAARADDELATQAIRNHDWNTAERVLQEGLQKDPGNVYRQLNLAWVYAQTGRKAEAEALYKEILKRDQDRFASAPGSDQSMSILAKRGLAFLKRN